MSQLFRQFLVGLLLLALVPAGCSVMPNNVPVTIPVLGAPPPCSGNLGQDTMGGGWNGALNLNLGTSTYALVCRATDPASGNDFIYLGISCNDFIATAATRVVLGVVTQTTPPSCEWKIDIAPFPVTGPNGIASNDFWRNMSNWNFPGGNTHQPPGLGFPYSNSWCWTQGGASANWSFEMRIPVITMTNNNGVLFPGPGIPFSVYLNVLNNSNAGGPGNVQYPWPSTATIAGAIDTHTPAVGLWGLAQF